jgi:hypothetical protein
MIFLMAGPRWAGVLGDRGPARKPRAVTQARVAGSRWGRGTR